MKKYLCYIAVALVCAGCARFRSTITEVPMEGGGSQKVTQVTAWTLFDSNSKLAQLESGQTDKSQRVEIGSLDQSSSGTNTVALIQAVIEAAVRAAIKP